MKFVYFGYDQTLPSVLRLIDEGHELIGIFGFECDNIFNFNTECQKLAHSQNIPFIISPAEDFHIKSFLDQGAEAFLTIGYPHKIPPIDETRAYAINVHPAYLPKARGLMPIPRIIMDHANEAAGFTAHKMTQDFDAGDILLQTKFELNTNETVETYTAKIAMRSPDMIAQLMNSLPELWKHAIAQNEKKASWFKAPTDQERFLDWNLNVQDIDRTGRAFGRFGSLAQINGKTWVIYDYDFWEEIHQYEAGEIVAHSTREITIAAANGFVCLKDFQPAQ